MNVDPRLQSYPFGNPDFAFASHPAAGQYDASLNPYGPNPQQPPNANGPATRTATSTRRQASRNAAQASPQPRIRGGGAAIPSSSLSGTSSPANTATHPRRPTSSATANTSTRKQNANNLVFKNSTSTFPQGSSLPDPSIIDFSSLPPPPSNLHSNTASDYFSSTHQPPALSSSTPIIEPSPPSPPPTTTESANPFSSTFPLVTQPQSLDQWRSALFNIPHALHLTQSQFLTYFPHIDNVYSHRSTQKYKRKPFVSHYWDCRLKGRPSGTKKSSDPNVKRRKREKRELGLCDVKIKITEWFGREEAQALGMTAVALGEAEADFGGTDTVLGQGDLQVVMENHASSDDNGNPVGDRGGQIWPKGHPGADGKKWYTIQRVNGSVDTGGRGRGGGGDDSEDEDMNSGEGGRNLDHKHTLEESDRIKKNSVQRWLLKEDKDKRGGKKSKIDPSLISTTSTTHGATTTSSLSSSSYLASGPAQRTVRLHQPSVPTHLTFFANAFCPFAQRVWIALELKNIPYRFVEVTPEMFNTRDLSLDPKRRDTARVIENGTAPLHLPPAAAPTPTPTPAVSKRSIPAELLEVCPDAIVPCIKHGNWGIWESNVMMEYLEDLTNEPQQLGGHQNAAAGVRVPVPLLPVNNPQLKAHCRLWVDHVNRKVLPSFYALLLTPPPPHHHRSSPHRSDDNRVENDAAITQRHGILVETLQTAITRLVNASHATGPFFLGESISYVDVAFAPWIIRLSRVLSYYRNFPRPEVGTRWQSWVDAIEGDERVRRTVSEEGGYHSVYRGVGEDGVGVMRSMSVSGGVGSSVGSSGGGGNGSGRGSGSRGGDKKVMVEMEYARKILGEEGFGLGGDLYGWMGLDPNPADGDGVAVSGR